LQFSGDGTNAQATLDSSGNLGLGVSPSAWRSGARALQSGANKYVSLWEQANGSANLAFAAYEGSSNTFNYTTTGDTPTLYSQLSGAHKWYNAASGTAGNTISFGDPKMTLDASGNLGVGTTSVSTGARVDIRGANNNTLSDLTAQALTVLDTTSYAQNVGGGLAFGYKYNSSGDYIARAAVIKAVKENGTDGNYATALVFATTANSASTTERARIRSDGKFLLNTTSTVVSGDEICGMIGTSGIGVRCQGGSSSFAAAFWNDATSGDNNLALFYTETAGTQRGSITYNRGAGQVAYNVTSDVRLKNNIADAVDAGSKVDALKVRQFDWKETGNHVDYGFVAQELDAIAPQAVSKPEDEEAMWSVDYSKLVPMLVKEIQSLRQRVAQLESK
jgi:hypothetical protein